MIFLSSERKNAINSMSPNHPVTGSVHSFGVRCIISNKVISNALGHWLSSYRYTYGNAFCR